MSIRGTIDEDRSTPWFSIVLLTVLLFLFHHDLFFSLSAQEGFSASLAEFTERVEEGSLLRRAVLLVLGLWAVVSLSLRARRKGNSGNRLIAVTIVLFLGWAALSIIWAVDPAIGLRRLIVLGLLAIGALAVAERFSLRDLILWMLVSSFAYLHLGVLAEIALGTFRPFSAEYRFSGTLHPNSQGINCAFLFIACGILAFRSARFKMLFICLALEAFLFLLLTKSRTCLGFALVAPFVFWVLTQPWSRQVAIALTTVFLACIFLLGSGLVVPATEELLSMGRSDSETGTLTGRVPLWGQLAGYISERPILGYGYDCFWTSRYAASIATTQDWVVTQGHSMYVDMMLSLGIVGLVLFVFILVGTVWSAVQCRRRGGDANVAIIGVVTIFALLNGIMESTMILSNTASFFTMVMVAKGAIFLRHPQSHARDREGAGRGPVTVV